MRKALVSAIYLSAASLALASDLGGDGLGGPTLQPRAKSAQLGEPGLSNRETAQVDPVLIEAGEPALDFRFAENKWMRDSVTNKQSLITFSRSAAQSPGTYVGADGLIHDAAVNLALYSEQFDNAAWSKEAGVTVTANQAIAPDGKQTADKVSSTTERGLWQTKVFGAGTYTFSVYLKATASTTGLIGRIYPGDMQSIDITTEWQRFHFTFTLSGSTTIYPQIRQSSDFGVVDVFIWGAQLEETDASTMEPTAYIHTTSQALAAPRFDHEPTTGNVTTNLLTYSEMLDVSSAWQVVRAIFSANAAIDPDGTLTADKLEETATTGEHQTSQTKTMVASTPYTFSVYAKADERDKMYVLLQNNGGSNGGFYASFDLTTGTTSGINSYGVGAGTSATITDVGNGWFRCAITGTTPNTSNDARIRILNAVGADSYAGVAGNGLYLYGAQLEAESSAGTYVRTLGETRSISDAVAPSLGLLVEEQRANAYKHSQNFADATFWQKAGASVSASSEHGAHGQFFEMSSTATNSEHTVFASSSNFTQATGTFTETVFLKYENWQYAFVGSNGSSSGNWAGVIVDLVNGTITDTQSNGTFTLNSSSIESFGDAFRVQITITSVTDGHRGLRVRFSNSATPTYSIYGVIIFTGSTNDKILIGGAQLETGTFATSYIPTTGSAQTRYADVAAVQDEDFSTTNLISYSESFDVGWTPSGVTINDDVAQAPDGTLTADEAVASTGFGAFVNRWFQSVSGSGKTISIYAKANTAIGILVRTLDGNDGNSNITFDLSNGTVDTVSGSGHSSYSIASAGNGWYRISVTSTTTYTQAYFAVSGAGLSSGKSIYVWGASLTATEYPVEYTTTRNLLTDSQDFERASWFKTAAISLTGNVIDPFGESNGAEVTVSSSGHAFANQQTVVPSTDYVFSFWAKRGTMTDVKYSVYCNATGTNIIAPTSYYSSINASTWTRVSFPFTTPVGCTSASVYVLRDSGVTGTMYAYGAQLEPGSTATDYVRTVDVVGKAYGFYEPTEGTVFASSTRYSNDNAYQRVVTVASSGGTNQFAILKFSTQEAGYLASPGLQVNKPLVSAGTEMRSAFAAKIGSHAFTINGASPATDSTAQGLGSGMEALFIGQSTGGSQIQNGHIKRLTYWPTRQADSTLQVITQ